MLPASQAKLEKNKNVRTFVTIDSKHLTMPTAVNSFSFHSSKKQEQECNCCP
jgi:hypothetical protein